MNIKTLRMRTLSPKKDESRGIPAATWVDRRTLRKMAARQAAAEMKRGGGERGSMERGKFRGFANSIGDVIATHGVAATVGGSTNANE